MNYISSIDNPTDADVLAHQSIDVHCHGVGRFDFTEINEIRFQEIEDILAARHHKSILTLYLPKIHFDDFLFFMDVFSDGCHMGKYPHIAGIALEGPLLASHGGTPHKGVWNPSKRQWQELAKCGPKGLIYIIFSPDADLDTYGSENLDTPATNTKWIAETLLKGGVLPAAGHFTRANPQATAQSLQSIYDIVKAWGRGPTLTDHLFNDMPLNFKHAWRTPEEKARREHELHELNLSSWNLENIEEKMGIVPATMIRNAIAGHVKIAMNFDGEHVDLMIAKKAIEIGGAENFLMMTDSIESKRLAGRALTLRKGSTLLYQDEGIVAAGSQNVLRQISNMIKIGLSFDEIKAIAIDNPMRLLALHQKDAMHTYSQMTELPNAKETTYI